MTSLSRFSKLETLRDGRKVEFRAITAEDGPNLLSAIQRSSPESLHRRFFGVRRHFSEEEIGFYSRVDFVSHVALVALVEEFGVRQIVGGARYIVTAAGVAEVAFAVVDEFQGLGIGSALMRHLVGIAKEAGLSSLQADVLQGNSQMIRVFAKSGLPIAQIRESDVIHITMTLGFYDPSLAGAVASLKDNE